MRLASSHGSLGHCRMPVRASQRNRDHDTARAARRRSSSDSRAIQRRARAHGVELRGLPCIELEDVTPDRKSPVASRSFGQAVETRGGLEEAVSICTARAAEKMRRQNLATASLAVWIETNSFKPTERQYSASKAVRLPMATADSGKLIAAASAALGIIFKPDYRYKKTGVTFLELTRGLEAMLALPTMHAATL